MRTLLFILLASAAMRGSSVLFKHAVERRGAIRPLHTIEGNLGGGGRPAGAPNATGKSAGSTVLHQRLSPKSDAAKRRYEGRLDCHNISGFECLQSYLNLPEPSYSWYDTGHRLTGTDAATGVPWTGYVLNMTSLTWLNADVVAWPEWWHIVVVIVPGSVGFRDFAIISMDFGLNSVQQDQPAFVVLENRGGAHALGVRQDALSLDLEVLALAVREPAYLAAHAGVATAAVFQAPNEVQLFASDPDRFLRFQDALMAWARVDFCYNMDQPERLGELALMKVVAKAMDTLTAFAADSLQAKITRFGVTGFSKLGKATWLSVADPRVEAIAPTNMPLGVEGLTRETRMQPWARGMTEPRELFAKLLTGTALARPRMNDTAFLGRMRRAGGAPTPGPVRMARGPPGDENLGRPYAPQSAPTGQPYWDYQSLYCPTDPEFLEDFDQSSRRLLEPLSYVEEFARVNKLFVQGVNDNWFDPFLQDIKQWFPEVPGAKRLLIVNGEHEHAWSQSLPQISAFFLSHLHGEKSPEVDWSQVQRSTSWQIRGIVTSEHVPISARLYFGTPMPGDGFVHSNFTEQPVPVVEQLDGNVAIVADVPIPSASAVTGRLPLTRAFVDVTYEANSVGDAPMISSPIYEFS